MRKFINFPYLVVGKAWANGELAQDKALYCLAGDHVIRHFPYRIILNITPFGGLHPSDNAAIFFALYDAKNSSPEYCMINDQTVVPGVLCLGNALYYATYDMDMTDYHIGIYSYRYAYTLHCAIRT